MTPGALLAPVPRSLVSLGGLGQASRPLPPKAQGGWPLLSGLGVSLAMGYLRVAWTPWN